ncbi:MAG: response regulator [Cyclobacteriaceae bacterium]
MKSRVLVVDDSAYSRMSVKNVIIEAGYEVVGEAKTGEEALDKISLLKPDIITLDNILPDMTGIQILQTLNHEKLPHCTIMISAVGQQSAIEEAMSLGAKAYLIKPFSEEQLLNELNLLYHARNKP